MKTIFIVDDNDANLFAAQKALSKHYNVFTLPSAEAMFELIADVSPDLILLDIVMPGMSGFEAMEALKKDKLYAGIPVIFLTGQVDLDTEVQGLGMGAADFIPKPFSEPVLLNRVKTHMDVDELVREKTSHLQKQIDTLEKQLEALKKESEGKSEDKPGNQVQTDEQVYPENRADPAKTKTKKKLREAQEELVNQNMRLNLLLSSLNIGLWDRYIDPGMAYDDSKAKIWWSDEFRKLLGYTDENDFPNEIGPWLDSVHPEDLQRTIDAMTSFLGDKTGTKRYYVENRMKTKAGEYKWFRSFGSAIRDADGNPIRTAGATEDITKRKEAEREILERGELNKILFDNAPVGLTIFDENYKFIDCNENILKIFGGISREYYAEFFGSPGHSPEYQPDGTKSYEKAMGIIKRVINNGENIKSEFVHNMPGGGTLPVELTITRLKRGKKYVGLAYIYDMREQYRLKEEIEKALREAESANKAKSDFLAKMSHEIRTPMNAILGVTEILMRSDTLPEDAQEALGRIYESGNLLMSIINDILDLSKIEAEKLEILPDKYEVPSLINDTVQLNLLRYDSKPIEFTVSIEDNTPHDMIGDELRIKQILNNLLSNAYKYTNEGEIKLTVSYEDIVEKMPGFDVMLILRVDDTGQGMTPGQVDELFTEYMRFNLETNRDTIGTGLGLSITKHLVDMMGGKISVESKPGEGSVFTVRLPQKRVGNAVCGKELTDKLRNVRFQSTALAKKSQFIREYMPYGSVLIVDDVDSNTYVAKGMLLPYGIDVDTASSGYEAIEKIKGGKEYDIIFMDHMMPKMDGMEATKIIRGMEYSKPIIALTANALVGQSEMFLQGGFDGYISKPIDSRELNHALIEHLRNKKPPEVVEAARREHAKRKGKTAQPGQDDEAMAVMTASTVSKSNPAEFGRFLLHDIKKAIDVICKIYARIDSVSDEDKKLYTVTVHGMRGALAIVGKKEAAAMAFRLEHAGKEWDAGLISESTPAFIDTLKSLEKEFSSQGKAADAGSAGKTDISESDRAFLREKLQAVKDACEKYNVSTARAALDDLLQKSWPDGIDERLHDISAELLHSAFKKAAAKADEMIKKH